MSNDLLTRLKAQLSKAAEVIIDKDKQYGSSWKQRGGVGAFMMFARKWDRIENALTLRNEKKEVTGYHDLFTLARFDNRPEGILDDLEDLRNYLILAIDEINLRKAEQDEAKRTASPRVRAK